MRDDHHKRDAESKAVVKKLLSERKKCLFTRLEKSFVEKYETPELQEKKKQLEAIRSLAKPINPEDIKNHSLKFAEKQKEHQERKKKIIEDETQMANDRRKALSSIKPLLKEANDVFSSKNT